MKPFPKAILVLCLLLGASHAFATHVAGGNIEYSHIAGDSFDVELFFYRDCDGLQAPTALQLEVACSQTSIATFFNVPMTYVGEVSQICPSALNQSACNGGTLEGVGLYHGHVVVDFAQLPPVACNSWELSYTVFARNPSINLNGTGAFFVYANLNNADFPTNSSAEYDHLELPFMYPTAQHLTFDVSATDPDGDSLVYTLDTALQDAGNPLGYFFGYSPQNPMPPLTLDSFSGIVTIAGAPPITGGEDNYVIVFRVDEYDPVSGQWKGATIRDFNAIIVPDSNKVPRLQSSGMLNPTGGFLIDSLRLQVVSGQNFCFDMVFADSNVLDSVFVNSNMANSIDNLSITQTGANPTVATVCGSFPAQSQPITDLSFLVEARDNHCPVYAKTTKTVGFRVLTPSNLPDDTICFGDSVEMSVPGTQVSWTALSGPPISNGVNFSCDTCDTVIASPIVTTTYVVQYLFPWVGVLTDTVTINVSTAIAASLTGPSQVCVTDTGYFSVSGTGSGLTYNWTATGGSMSLNGSANTAVIYPVPGQFGISVTVSDSNCSETVSSPVTVNALPNVVAGFDQYICSIEEANLSVTGADSYLWSPASSLDDPTSTWPAASPSTTTVYTVVGTDTNGCSDSDSLTVVVQPTYLAGIAEDNNGNAVQNSTVYMIKYEAAQDTVYSLDITTTDAQGAFQFLAIEDSVFVKVAPDSTSYPNLLPTYHDSATTIQTATVIDLMPCSLNTVSVIAVQGLNPGGPGFIGGYVSLGAGRSEPVSGLSVLIRNANGRRIAQETTDAQGYFRFENLTAGGYYIDVDRWGVQNNQAPFIDLREGESRDDFQFVLYAKYLDMLEPSGEEEINGRSWSMYPNPTTGLMHLDGIEFSGVVHVHSLDGKRLRSEAVRPGNNTLDLSSLSAGSYMMEVEQGSERLHQLIIKQ